MHDTHATGTQVVIIEDEADICRMLQHTLRNARYRIECAGTIAEGLRKITASSPDIVLLDNNLPDGWGVDAIERIKRISPRVRVIMISAMEQMQELAVARGAEGLVAKPFTSRQVLHALAGPAA